MIKICAYVKLYALHNKSGGELYLHHFLKEIKKNVDCEIDIFVYDNEKKLMYDILEEYDGMKIINLNNDNLGLLNNYDVVITHLDMTIPVCDYCLKFDIKCFLIIHSYYKNNIEYTKNNKIFSIYNSTNTKSEFVKYNHSNNYNCVILPYFNFELYSKYYMYEVEDREYISFINPSESKGAEVVLKIIKHFPNKKFLVVEGGYYPHLQRLDEFRKFPNCHIIKQTDDVLNDIYLKSKIVLQPSHIETFGMVASEAGSLGIPVLINKDCDGLIANLGKMSLGGFSCKDPKDYIKYINMLDDKNIYGIYSFYMTNVCENNYNKRQEQLNLLFDNWGKILKKKKI
jgi:hypothetical protein